MDVRRPESPYLLAPGPQRREMMREMGIVVCLLDYDDEEWAEMQSSRPAIDGPQHLETGGADDTTLLA